MSGVNSVTLIGRLGADPESREAGDTRVTNFTLATSYKPKDKDEVTEWTRIVTWGKLAEICEKYLVKGKQVYVLGRLQTRSWEDKDGNKRYTTEVVASQVQFLGGASDTADPKNHAPQESAAPKLDESEELPF